MVVVVVVVVVMVVVVGGEGGLDTPPLQRQVRVVTESMKYEVWKYEDISKDWFQKQANSLLFSKNA